jgi:hypothetical protein
MGPPERESSVDTANLLEVGRGRSGLLRGGVIAQVSLPFPLSPSRSLSLSHSLYFSSWLPLSLSGSMRTHLPMPSCSGVTPTHSSCSLALRDPRWRVDASKGLGGCQVGPRVRVSESQGGVTLY